MKSEHSLPAIERIVKKFIPLAIKYEKVSGKPLGITAEVGEVIAARKLRLVLEPPRTPGYDASKNGYHYQIKTRRVNELNARAKVKKLGSFSNHRFHYAVLVILDKRYQLIAIYQTSFSRVRSVIQQVNRRNPSIRQFIRVSKKIY